MANFDMYAIVQKIFEPLFITAGNIIRNLLAVSLISVVLFLLLFFIRYGVNPFKPSPERLKNLQIKFKLYDLMRWLIYDFLTRHERSHIFQPYGFTIFVGRQGAGKTISMIQYLNDMKAKYPDCIIVTNFWYKYANHRMEDWRDLLEIRNGEKGVIFAIDEIHSEYSSASWKDFPESLLSEISMQRKQKVKIVGTAQVFSRVAKPIREQAFSVVCCDTYFGRLTFNREYDAAEYSTSDNPYQVKKKVKALWKSRFVQSNYLRNCYDTYEKIERMKKIEFIPRNERH